MSLESDNSSFWVESDDDYDIPEPKSDFEFNISAETFEYECYSFVKGDFEFLQNVDLVVNGIVGLPVAVVGIGINLFFLVVLCGARLRRVLLNQVLNFTPMKTFYFENPVTSINSSNYTCSKLFLQLFKVLNPSLLINQCFAEK